MNMLILYATTDGQTQKIAEAIAQHARASAPTEAKITVMNLTDSSDLELSEFDTILLGARVRYGRFQREVAAFINQYQAILREKQFGFFSVNLTARKPEKATPETSAYSKKLYQKIPVQPDIDAVFAGKLNYPKYRLFDRLIIQMIMRLTGGPTDPTTVKEYTDWEKVRQFADQLINHHTDS